MNKYLKKGIDPIDGVKYEDKLNIMVEAFK